MDVPQKWRSERAPVASRPETPTFGRIGSRRKPESVTPPTIPTARHGGHRGRTWDARYGTSAKSIPGGDTPSTDIPRRLPPRGDLPLHGRHDREEYRAALSCTAAPLPQSSPGPITGWLTAGRYPHASINPADRIRPHERDRRSRPPRHEHLQDRPDPPDTSFLDDYTGPWSDPACANRHTSGRWSWGNTPRPWMPGSGWP